MRILCVSFVLLCCCCYCIIATTTTTTTASKEDLLLQQHDKTAIEEPELEDSSNNNDNHESTQPTGLVMKKAPGDTNIILASDNRIQTVSYKKAANPDKSMAKAMNKLKEEAQKDAVVEAKKMVQEQQTKNKEITSKQEQRDKEGKKKWQEELDKKICSKQKSGCRRKEES